MQIISARPPGNVHGEQSFEIERLPAIGATVVTDLACVAKEIKRERRWLTFATRTRDEDGSPLFTGVMKIAWAKCSDDRPALRSRDGSRPGGDRSLRPDHLRLQPGPQRSGLRGDAGDGRGDRPWHHVADPRPEERR